LNCERVGSIIDMKPVSVKVRKTKDEMSKLLCCKAVYLCRPAIIVGYDVELLILSTGSKQ
jgi:hypothetical protein